MAILDKKEFYKMLLRDRFPVAKIEFPTENQVGSIEFYPTPLGTLLCIHSGGAKLKEIKMYDRAEGNFALKNAFCGDNLLSIDNFEYISIVNGLQIQDIIGRKFLIKLENITVIARAEFIQKQPSNLDKSAGLVYN